MTQDFDEDRHLCPDGACIGVLDADGRCKVCGRSGTVGAAYREAVYDAADDEADTAEVIDDKASPAQAEDGDDDDRRLCPDGACIGLLGDDGRCKVCGKSAP
jgi:hypothetical protein